VTDDDGLLTVALDKNVGVNLLLLIKNQMRLKIKSLHGAEIFMSILNWETKSLGRLASLLRT
jgi:hypothetical protein